MFLGVQQKIQTEIEKSKQRVEELKNNKDAVGFYKFEQGRLNAYSKALEFIEEEVLNSEELAHLSQAAKLLEEKR